MDNNEKLLKEQLIEHLKYIHLIAIKLQLERCFQNGDSCCTFDFLTIEEIDELCQQGFSLHRKSKTWFVSK